MFPGANGCPNVEPGNQCLGTGTKSYCVHTLSTRYVTVYIVTHFALSDAFSKVELSNEYKAVDFPRTN